MLTLQTCRHRQSQQIQGGMRKDANLTLAAEAAISADVSHPKLGVIPGHVGVIPGNPRQLGAILAQARVGVEVIAARKH